MIIVQIQNVNILLTATVSVPLLRFLDYFGLDYCILRVCHIEIRGDTATTTLPQVALFLENKRKSLVAPAGRYNSSHIKTNRRSLF